MKLRRGAPAVPPDDAGKTGEAAGRGTQPKRPTHRAIAQHVSAGQTFEMEIGAAWEFTAKSATGYTVVLREVPPASGFDLIEIAPKIREYQKVTSPTPQGTMPHLRAATKDERTGRYHFTGDAWRSLADDTSVRIHVRLHPGTKTLRFALFDAPVWQP